MRSLLHLLLVMCVAAAAWGADTATKAQARVISAGTILQQIQAAPDHGIPEKVLASAACVAIVPSMLNGGFALGLRYGRGVATCRTPKGWSAPAFFVVQGGSFGLQFGGQASIAAGPVGRQTGAETDWKMRAQVLTYARSRGAFIGATLEHGKVQQDKDSTRAFYGHLVRPRTSLTGEIDAPSTTYPFLEPLSEWAQAAAEK